MSKKKVNIIVVGKDEAPNLYETMNRLIAEHHDHLAEADIVLAWHLGWKEDVDGHLRLGQAQKASELHKQLHRHDFVIVLNHHVINKANFTAEQMTALLDHELSHCEVAKDEDGQVKMDANGNTVYRMRKHDVEEFVDVVQRHGVYKGDLEKLARAAIEAETHPLLVDVEQVA